MFAFDKKPYPPAPPVTAAKPAPRHAAGTPPVNPLWMRLATSPAPLAPARVSGTDDGERAQEEMARFQAGAPYFLHNYRPSTGRGFFDAMYHPPSLYITVKVRFGFADTAVEDWPGATPADVTWTDAQKEAYKQRFMTDVSAKWTQAGFRLYCIKKGWESLSANVVVKFVDVEKSVPPGLGLTRADVKAHFDLLIRKIPPGRQLQSLTIPPGGTRADEGVANLDSEGLTPRRNETGNRQRSAVHESGHMLGLGDTYAGMSTVTHGKLAEKEAGETIPIADDGRLMSRGDSLGRTDAVVFVEAMRKTTNMAEWSLNPRIPRVPVHPDDGVPPRETVA